MFSVLVPPLFPFLFIFRPFCTHHAGYPILLIVGNEDQMVLPAFGFALYEALKSDHTHFEIYEIGGHALWQQYGNVVARLFLDYQD